METDFLRFLLFVFFFNHFFRHSALPRQPFGTYRTRVFHVFVQYAYLNTQHKSLINQLFKCLFLLKRSIDTAFADSNAGNADVGTWRRADSGTLQFKFFKGENDNETF